MKKSRWFDPYIVNAKGKEIPAIRDCWTCAQAGVYLIRHKQTGSVVYVGSSTTQLKSTIYRHFQQWTDKQQRTGRSFERKVYPKTGYYEIRFFKCTAEQALKIEKYLIIKLQPKDNPLKYQKLTEEKKEAGEKLYSKILQSETIPKEDYLEEAPF
jgi:hypothetical protein